ncbi:MAG: PAS domain S-box protein [Anaerolineae bacterium]|nr:PAS domain S-box protein [Anaerolineae bacterium]
MGDTGKSREELVSELAALRERVKELEDRAPPPVQYEHQLDEIIGTLQSFSEAAFEALFLTEEGICLGINQAAGEMFDCSVGKAFGKKIEEWVIPEDREIVAQKVLSGSEESYEVTAQRKDGSTFSAEIRIKPIPFDKHIFQVIALRDISSLRLAERELTRTQSLLASVIEQSPTPIAIARPDGSLEMVNDAGKELLGIQDAPDIPEVFNFEQPWKEYDVEGNLNADDQMALALALKGKAVKGKEIRVVREDGSERWVLVDSIPVYDGEGNLIAGVAIFPDITELKQAEDQLVRTRLLLTSVIEQAPIPIIVARPDGMIEMVNQASREQLGVLDEPETGAGINLFDFEKTWIDYGADGSHIPTEELPLAQALQGKTTKQREMRVVRKDGSERWELVDGGPVYDDEGNLIAGLIMFPDITALKQTEEQLRTSHRHLTALMDNSSDYIVIGDETGAPVLFNNAYKQVMKDLIGIEMKPGIKPHTLLADKSAVAYWEGLHRRVLGGESFRVEYNYPVVKGELRHFEFSFTPIIEEGKVKGFSEISRDITNRKLREEMLKDSETRFRAIFENSIDAIAVSRNALHIAVNDAYLKMYGYDDMSELIGKPVLDLIPPSERERVAQKIRRHALSGTLTPPYETVGLRRDGTEFDIDVHISTYTLSGNTYSVIFLRDITEKKKAERELRESRARFESLVQASPIGIILLSNRNILEVNEYFCNMLGYTRDELIGQNACILYVDQEEYERVGQEKYDLIREHGIGTVETRWQCKDGTVLDILLSSTPLDPDNWDLGVISTSLDITQRKRAEKALLESEQRLSNIVEALPLGIHLYRLEPDGKLVFSGSNPAADRILGVENQQFVGKPLEEAFPPLADTEVPARYRRAASEGKAWFAEQIDYQHGDIVGAYEVNAFQISPGQMGALFRDITARKQAAQELERYREHLEDLVAARTVELESANRQLLALSRVKDEFISNVSHELRSPITSLKVNLHALNLRPEKRDAYTMSLQRELTRLENLVENLLAVSRLDQERVKFTFDPVYLNELLEVYVNDRRAVAEQEGLTLAIKKSANLPPVSADRNQLDQVVSILLTNALNYTQTGGTVTISTRVDSREGREYVCFSISDTGPGISPEDRARLFERFFRGKAGRDSGAPGTGLGLTIAKEIVDRHGGLIDVNSEGLGKGAVFTVWLPAEGGDIGRDTAG